MEYLPSLSVTCREMYASALDLFHKVTSVNGTAGGNVPYNRIPRVGDAVGSPGMLVGLAVTAGFGGNSVAVTIVAVRSGGGNVAVSPGSGWVGGKGVSLGFARTGVDEGRGDGMGEGGALVVTITAVGVASPGMSNGRHAPNRIKMASAGNNFFMASPGSTTIR